MCFVGTKGEFWMGGQGAEEAGERLNVDLALLKSALLTITCETP